MAARVLLTCTFSFSGTAYCYLCGHLHSLVKLVPAMYTVQPQGFLELELADWRDGRFFRIVAVDNDLVSFVDSQVHEDESQDWPIVLITNPKDAGFLLPNKEPTNRILSSSHIRILAWSNSPITRISVTVDNVYLGDAKPAVRIDPFSNSSPLFVLPWNPDELMRHGPNVHTISAVCKDANGNSRKVEQFFTLDGTTRWHFGGLQSFILLYDHVVNLTVAFCLVWSIPFFALLIARIFGRTHIYSRICADFCQLEGLREVASSDVLFISLISYLLYLIFGPIFMGYLLEESFGFVFTFGVYIHNTYLREGTTYLSEIIQQLIFTYPLIILLILRMRGRRSCQRTCFCCRFFSKSCLESLGIVLLIVLQLAFSILEVLLPYGWMAFILSPGRLWLVVLALSLFIYSGREVMTRREEAIVNSLIKSNITPVED
ncbi:unnamed protein product [Hymenolepis diminuta]|uniref:Transmembrane protein 62 n=1 Tax=Hymenolepis diminuta TaxID=6216 RepID=A0A564YMR9_HYMDI|nr:unnamed protein product [Hymenolepis diminuta]